MAETDKETRLVTDHAHESLGSGQKLQVWRIMIVGFAATGALLTFAGFFALRELARDVAKASVSDSVKAEIATILPKQYDEVAQKVIQNDAFKRLVDDRVAPLPRGAVVAFTVDSFGAGRSCPSGWSEYKAGQGRVILGIGTSPGGLVRKLGDTGGAGSVMLKPENVPEHRHKPYMDGGRIIQGVEGGQPFIYGLQPGGTFRALDATGGVYREPNFRGIEAVPTMPPFIALQLCEKS